MERDDIIIICGTGYKNMAERVLEQAGVAADIGDVNKKIALKPNPVIAEASSNGVTTHNELLAGVIEYLQEHSSQNITIIEGSQVDDHAEDAFQVTGYHQVCSRYSVPFVDLQRDTWKEYDAAGVKTKLCDKAAAVDYMISIPVLRGYCQATITCAPKNNKGVAPNLEKHRFCALGLHKLIAHLNTTTCSGSILVGNICGDSDFEKGGSPVTMNHVLGLKDPVLCDIFVCNRIGYSVDDMPYITMAGKLGMGSTNTVHINMIYLNQTTEAGSKFRMTRHVRHLIAYTAPEDACSAYYGSLTYALDRLNDMGHLRGGLSPACIGQGYKGQDGAINVKQYTSCSAGTLGGYPSKAADIMDFLSTQWK